MKSIWLILTTLHGLTPFPVSPRGEMIVLSIGMKNIDKRMFLLLPPWGKVGKGVISNRVKID